MSIAVLFAYDGHDFDGLERLNSFLLRNNGENSIEHFLFKAIAAQYPEGTPIQMTHISRAAATHERENASKQVISLNLTGAPELPNVMAMNKLLPDSIRVFKVMQVDEDFSARRTCEARTVEYLIPTYAFAPPPEATEYCYPEEDDTDVAPGDLPQGGLFQTLKKSHSLARRGTFIQRNGEFQYNESDIVDEKPLSVEQFDSQTTKKRPGMFSCFSGFASSGGGSERLKESLNATLKKGNPVTEEQNFTTTLSRTLSRKNRNLQQVLAQDINERENEVGSQIIFEPLNIPAPNAEEKQCIRQFRLSETVYQRIVFALALFNGTHNFHNYIPGSVQSDTRCFVRVFNIEASPVEIHHGMEWVRIKIQARSFGRDQIRRMMAMLIMVIRTNTTRSVIANSFGIADIDIPEAPQDFLILEQPHYNNYNADCKVNKVQPVTFGDVTGLSEFNEQIHESIYSREFHEMKFEQWLRDMDNYSFLYTYFLNERGLIMKPRNFPKDQ